MIKKFLTEYTGQQELVLTIDSAKYADFTRAWAGALHGGFALHVPKTMYVRELLTAFAGLAPDYVEDRIQAVFVDGHPVDDIDTAPVRPLQELSLSSAMPGVAGIVMGRANAFAVYRRDITFHADDDAPEHGPGLILMRLFNFIAPEAGHHFLALGAGLDTPTWHKFTHDLPTTFWSPVRQATLDGHPIAPDTLPPVPAGELRFVRVQA